MNREEFNSIFVKLLPQYKRYTYKILQSKFMSNTKLTIDDYINNVYLRLNDKNIEQLTNESHTKHFVLKCIVNEIRAENNRIVQRYTNLQDNALYINNEIDMDHLIYYLSHNNSNYCTMPDYDYKIDAQPYINLINTHPDKMKREFFIDYLSLTTGKTGSDNTFLYKKHNISQTKAKNLSREMLYWLENTITKTLNRPKALISLSKDNKKITLKQREIENNIKNVVKYLKQNIKITEIAKLLNVNRSTVYWYIKKINERRY